MGALRCLSRTTPGALIPILRFVAEHRLKLNSGSSGCVCVVSLWVRFGAVTERSSIFACNDPHSQTWSVGLIHGDLWICLTCIDDTNGQPALIDPAAHYGWPEADLAMTIMFGRLPQRVYDTLRRMYFPKYCGRLGNTR